MSTFAMHVAKTGLNSQQIKMQVIANNLANVNTTSAADRANFTVSLRFTRAGDNIGKYQPTSASVGTGTRLQHKLHTQGSLITGNSLDISIEGDGFFKYYCQTAGSLIHEVAHSLEMLRAL